MASVTSRGELLILYGSQTGTAQEVAEQVEEDAVRRRFAVRCLPMDAYPVASLPNEQLLVTICSTTGQGDPPDNMRAFWQFLRRRDLPAGALARMRHTCFGLGDSSYPKFNVAARRLAARLVQLGSKPLAPPGYGDEQDELGTEQALQPWLSALWAALDDIAPMPAGLAPLPVDTPPPLRFVLAPAASVAPPPAPPGGFSACSDALAPAWSLLPPPPPPGTDARSPLLARVSANVHLSARPAERDVRHIELLLPIPALAPVAPAAAEQAAGQERAHATGRPPGSPGSSALEAGTAADSLLAAARALPAPHAPGDSLGVWPQNSDAAVERCLARLQATAPAGATGAEAFEGNALVEVLCSPADARTGALTRPIPPGPLPLRLLLRDYVDLSAPPRRRFCAALARCTDETSAEGAAQAARLREFAAPSGQALLREYAGKPRRTALEVLLDFGHGRPRLRDLLGLLAPMAPRYYSIASDPGGVGVRLLALEAGERGGEGACGAAGCAAAGGGCSANGASKGGSPASPAGCAGGQSMNGCCVVAAQAVHLCVAVLRYHTFLRDEREGLCSTFLARLTPPAAAAPAAAFAEPAAAYQAAAGQDAAAAAVAGADGMGSSGLALNPAQQIVDGRALPCARVWYRAGSLRMPADEGTPLIMVGPGTGVAPFRAFVQRRCRLARVQQPAGPALPLLSPAPVPQPPHGAAASCALFFGCRSARLDHLYEEEWAAAHSAGVLARVPVAFSRDGPAGQAKTYVQGILARPEMGALVRGLLRRGGCVYVAGAAGAMPRDVREALCGVLRGGDESDGGGLSEAEAEAAVRALELSGRYQVEVWG